MRNRLAAVTIVLLVACVVPQGASAELPELEFVEPSEVVVTISDETSTKASVWVRNASGDDVTPTFSANVEESDGDSVAADSVEVAVVDNNGNEIDAPEIGANQVERYRVFLRGDGLEEEVSGQLVSTASGLAPGSVPVSASLETVEEVGVDSTLWLALGGAVLLLLVSVAWALPLHDGEVPGGDLDFSKSFASTLTVVGALLGTALSAGVLPDDSGSASKEAFIALSLLFAIAVVVAGAVYAALPPKVWAYLVAAFITMWAVIGELVTLFQLVDALGQDDGFTEVAIAFFRGLLVVALIAVAVYAVKQIRAVNEAAGKPTPGAAAAAFAALSPSSAGKRIPLL